MRTVIEDLFAYNDWAHERIFRLCDGLTDEQLDHSREIGFGTLRATLYHNLAAEQIWLERWTGVPWRPFPIDPQGTPLAQIAESLRQVASERREFLESERSTNWKRAIEYIDSKGNKYSQSLDQLLVHVANHGIHHRAQALSFLKQFDRTVPVGLDHLFFRVAFPTVTFEPSSVEQLKGYGLEVGVGQGVQTEWDRQAIADYFAYNDWATGLVLESAEKLDDAALDRPIDMGLGSIRKNLLHLYDAEAWWLKNWDGIVEGFSHSPADWSMVDLQAKWNQVLARRNEYIASLDAAEAQKVLDVIAGGTPVRFRVIESLIQLCCHGTHHRAQLVNMLRQCGVSVPASDYMIWARL